MSSEQVKAEKQFEEIALLIREREREGLRTYYTLRIEKHGNSTTIASRKTGENNFRSDINQAIRMHQPQAVTVELYRGHSRRVREPESSFYVEIGSFEGMATAVQGFSGFGNPQPVNGFFSGVGQVQPTNYAPYPQDHSDKIQNILEAHQKERDKLLNEHFFARTDIVVSQIEGKQKDEKIKELKSDLEEAYTYIKELEKMLKTRPQYTGIGGVKIVELGSLMLESFLKRNPQLLKTAFNINDAQLAGIFETTQDEQDQPSTPAPQVQGTATAKVIMTPNEPTKPTYTSEEQRRHFEAADQLCAAFKAVPFKQYARIHGLLLFMQNNPIQAEQIFRIAENPTPPKPQASEVPQMTVVPPSTPVAKTGQQNTAPSVKPTKEVEPQTIPQEPSPESEHETTTDEDLGMDEDDYPPT